MWKATPAPSSSSFWEATAPESRTASISTTSVDPDPALAGKTVTGGRLDAARAVAGLSSPQPPAPRPLAPTRALVRRGGIVGAHLFLPEGGSLALALVRGRRTLAEGACSLLAAGRCRFALRLTRNGRVLLRFSRRFRASLTLAYAPRTGRVLLMHTAVILGRTGSTPRRLGGHA